jgi:phosphate ABC transporter permease protein PstC
LEAGTATVAGGGRSILERSPLSRLPDRALRWGLSALAAAILVLLVYFFIRLIGQSNPSLSHNGLAFVFGNDWDVSRGIFHAAPMLVGTLVTSALALIIGVPVAVAAALFITELCPRRARGALSILIDLLAAVPSVVYGLWGVFVLAPKLLPIEKWFASTFSFIPWIGGGTPALYNYFIAGLILAIMILPIVSAISREVIATVPAEHKEAALALGATRWEMIRMAVLPYARPGITGGAMLGLGRAVGETIAVFLVIGEAPTLGAHVFSQGNSFAAVIAAEFGEAGNDPMHRSALFEAGLVLFILTLIVNVIARRLVSRGERGRRGTGGTGITVAAEPAERPAV